MRRRLLSTVALLVCASLLLWGATTGTLSIAASGDDVHRNSDGWWPEEAYNTRIGQHAEGIVGNASFRYTTGVTDLSGATILTCTVNFMAGNSAGSPAARIYVEHQAGATQTTSDTDWDGRTMSTAYVAWAPSSLTPYERYDLPDLSVPLQEVVDAHGNLTTIQIFVKDNGSAVGSYQGMEMYDVAPSWAATLVVTYTPAAGGRRRILMIQ